LKKLSLNFPSQAIFQALIGPHDKRLKMLSSWFNTEVFAKEGSIYLENESVISKIEPLMQLWIDCFLKRKRLPLSLSYL